MDESGAINQAIWDERAPAHAASPDYDVRRFVDDPDYLSEVVRFDLPRLGDIAGLRCVHLQCHIGTDTVSLARLGATVTGLDFSSASLAEARRLSAAAGTPVEFVESDVYAAVEALGAEQFDLVYTGVGALNWLPDVRRWAGVVAGLLVDRRPPVHPRRPSDAVVARRRARRRNAGRRVPVLRDRRARRVRGARRPTCRPITSSSTPRHTSGTTGSERSSPRSSMRGWSSPASSSTTACHGTRSPA